MIERAQQVIVVTDSSKIGNRTLAKMADCSEVQVLVTDADADPVELDRIRALGVDVRLVEVS